MKRFKNYLKQSAVLLSFASVTILIYQNCSNVNFAILPECEQADAPGLQPKLKWDWYSLLNQDDPANFPKFSQVMSTPMVADLDMNGVPEVVFTSWSTDSTTWYQGRIGASYTANGVLRIVSGTDGKTIRSIGEKDYAPFGTTSPLLIDMNKDGKLEIVYFHYTGTKIIALNHDGTFRWSHALTTQSYTYGGLAAADFNEDGRADLLVGNQILTENNELTPENPLRRLVTLENASTQQYQFAYSLDPARPNELQIIGRNGVFSEDGKKRFDFSDKSGAFKNQALFYAAAEIDHSRPGLEIVGTGNGYLGIFDGISGSIFTEADLNQEIYNDIKCSANSTVGGGPPTIGNFDENPETIEIAMITGRYFSIFNSSGTLVAKYLTQDCSSRMTGISSFDFNGDKKAEILYADEEYLRVFELNKSTTNTEPNGYELNVVYKIANPSGTLLEYPVVADINGDGSAEIILASNNYAVGGFYKDPEETADAEAALKITGVRAFEAETTGKWMATRPIWNQFDFNPALVTQFGRAVSRTPLSGITSTHFRRNSQISEWDMTCKSTIR